MGTTEQLAAIAGGLIAAELITQAGKPAAGDVGVRHPEALEPLQGFQVNPCGGAIGRRAESLAHLWTTVNGKRIPKSYSAAWSLQRVSLEEQFGTRPRKYCTDSGCFSLWGTRPAAPGDCLLAVVTEWAELKQRLEAAAQRKPEILSVPDFKGSSWQDARDLMLELQALVLWDADEPNRDDRAWDKLQTLAVRLQASILVHDDPRAEAAAELWDTVTSADSYGRVVAGALGTVGGFVAKVAGNGVANFLMSDAGAMAAVAGAGYLLLKKG